MILNFPRVESSSYILLSDFEIISFFFFVGSILPDPSLMQSFEHGHLPKLFQMESNGDQWLKEQVIFISKNGCCRGGIYTARQMWLT